jgi:hypothetical protein
MMSEKPKPELSAPPPSSMIDEPTPFDTLRTWESHRLSVRALPDSDPAKLPMLDKADQMIAELRKRG